MRSFKPKDWGAIRGHPAATARSTSAAKRMAASPAARPLIRMRGSEDSKPASPPRCATRAACWRRTATGCSSRAGLTLATCTAEREATRAKIAALCGSHQTTVTPKAPWYGSGLRSGEARHEVVRLWGPGLHSLRLCGLIRPHASFKACCGEIYASAVRPGTHAHPASAFGRNPPPFPSDHATSARDPLGSHCCPPVSAPPEHATVAMVRHAILPVCPASLVIRPVRTMDMSALHTDCVAVLTATFLARGGIICAFPPACLATGLRAGFHRRIGPLSS